MVHAEWQNPVGLDGPIDILVNGALVDTLDSDETMYVIEDPLEEDFTIEVINGSCVPSSCVVCFNDPPVPAIAGPSQVVLDAETGTVTVRLDASASTDGDDGTQQLFPAWQVALFPPGARADIVPVDEAGFVIDLTVDSEGEYAVELALADSGCPGDITFGEATLRHTLTVSSGKVEPQFRRGDTDRSGAVELTDAIGTLNFLFLGGPAPGCPDAADADNNGVLELTDAVRALGFLFLGDPPPTDPGPFTCGPDPAAPADGLSECVYESC
jgi:hypothetical protein